MPVNIPAYQQLLETLNNKATLVAVSKTKPVEDIIALYDLGQRDFGENYVQELVDKQATLPKDIRWHFIGHLQSNKVKYIAPFVHLIHGVDSLSLLSTINKQAEKLGRRIDCLLQVHIAMEETKFGLDETELSIIMESAAATRNNIRLRGLMGMASFSDDQAFVRKEFSHLKTLFAKYAAIPTRDNIDWQVLSMGMSADYRIALEEGSTMIRVGSLLFGTRNTAA